MADGGVPEPVAYVRDLLAGLAVPWVLCGGWAADAWLGRVTRDHFDVDIAVFHQDQSAIFDHFPGWALVGHDPNVPDATTEPWNGRKLDMPAHIHFPELGSPLSTEATAKHSAYEFEILLNEAADHRWILSRDREISVPLDRAIRTSPWGVPTAAPEVVLFFKAGGNPLRPRDEADFFALLPTLTAEQRSWLRESLSPEHPWSTHLAA